MYIVNYSTFPVGVVGKMLQNVACFFDMIYNSKRKICFKRGCIYETNDEKLYCNAKPGSNHAV